jgi:hypothetical protein
VNLRKDGIFYQCARPTGSNGFNGKLPRSENLKCRIRNPHTRGHGGVFMKVYCYFIEIGFRFEEEHTVVVHLVHSFMWCWKFETSECNSDRGLLFTEIHRALKVTE